MQNKEIKKTRNEQIGIPSYRACERLYACGEPERKLAGDHHETAGAYGLVLGVHRHGACGRGRDLGRIRRHPHRSRAQERGKDQRKGYGEIARHRNYNHLRRGDGRAAAHQRPVGLGRLKMNCTGVGAAIAALVLSRGGGECLYFCRS